ncbi:hypothetical protein P7K49_026017 [Saguinus oedipus]|uniref:ABC transporter domain-containing protein n=1 Tax=Saguinus oedipus TaxID=9490 RepID=A0ABQ9UKD0_SAGOE|nr:hypothetical protein P7K49_026017 [Saguinus oedipus]
MSTITIVLTFSCHILLRRKPTVPAAFSVIAMFNVMMFDIEILPSSVKAMAKANVSLRRMKKILKDKSSPSYITQPEDPNTVLLLANATLTWKHELAGKFYLLDDALSAMDAHLGKHVFEGRIKMMLRGKTMVLVTHQLHFLESCDEVILLEDGEICENGSHKELMEERGRYAKLIHNLQGLQFKDAEHLYNAAMVEAFRENPAERGEDAGTIVLVHHLIQTESPWEGTVTWKTSHVHKASGG